MEGVFVLVKLFYYGDGILFEEARQVAEVGVLVEFVEDGAGGIFEVGGGEDSDGVWRELFGELGAAFKVLEGADARRDCSKLLACVEEYSGRSHLPRPSKDVDVSHAAAAQI
jgi:hypothetical protein